MALNFFLFRLQKQPCSYTLLHDWVNPTHMLRAVCSKQVKQEKSQGDRWGRVDNYQVRQQWPKPGSLTSGSATK